MYTSLCVCMSTHLTMLLTVFYDNLRLSAIDVLADADMSLSFGWRENLVISLHFYDAHPAW